ncbi:hypothetical protein [Pseudomonas putida]|uniref:hypothetical protein n=1 Tax=Pseudomonas putida TaxID=303 RepID=UPI001EE4BB80|nr:hypothetical protein [Pseudomonas putida]
MNENMSKNGQTAIINPGWYRFKLGSFEITVVSDGPMPLIPPSSGFSDAPPEDVESLLSENFLPTDRLMLGMRIPRSSGHPFHEHLTTDSTLIRPPIPRASGH